MLRVYTRHIMSSTYQRAAIDVLAPARSLGGSDEACSVILIHLDRDCGRMPDIAGYGWTCRLGSSAACRFRAAPRPAITGRLGAKTAAAALLTLTWPRWSVRAMRTPLLSC